MEASGMTAAGFPAAGLFEQTALAGPMDLHSFYSDAAHWGWTLALVMRVTSRLERLLGLRVFRVSVRGLNPAHNPVALPEGFTVRALDPATLTQLSQDPDLELDPAFVEEALANGDVAYGVFDRGELTGYTWRSFSSAPFFEGLWVKVPRPLQYGYKAYTLPSQRGRGIYRAFAGFADRQAWELGYLAMLALIDVSNIASLRASQQMGSKQAGYAGYLKLFGRCFTFRTPAARDLGVEIFARTPRVSRSSGSSRFARASAGSSFHIHPSPRP
jgi:hypothetical protein